MGKNKKSGIGRSGGGEKKQAHRPTHFLCFPLARDSTVPTIAKSIKHFQDVSLEPRQPHPYQAKTSDFSQEPLTQEAASEPQKATDAGDPLGNVTRAKNAETSFEDSLKVLPSIVYRGPGTLHLTLGVMDLSDPHVLEKATQLLQGLDLQKMLRDAASGPPAGMKAARKWESKEKLSHEKIEANGSEPISTPVDSLAKPISPPATSRAADHDSESTPVRICLTGISAFASAKKARVIWAKPRAQSNMGTEVKRNSAVNESTTRPTFSKTEQDRLYNFGLHVHYAFKAAGLITETRPIVLHATIANMRYKMQAKGGRTSKGRAWTHGKKRWEDGLVDVRNLVRVFNEFDGDVQTARSALSGHEGSRDREIADVEQSDDEEQDSVQEEQEIVGDRDMQPDDPEKEFIWCSNILVDRVAICKMGATKLDDALWVETYPPISEKMIIEESSSAA